MDRIELEASPRKTIGKQVKFLRHEGKTPANLYGHGIDSIALQADTKQLEQLLLRVSKTDLITLQISGSDTPRRVFVREVQRNALTDVLLHVDFYQVKLTEKIKADIPLKYVGEAPVLKKKNITLLHFIDSVHVEALPDALPHNIEVDLSELAETDQAIFVKDIVLAKDITLLSDPEQMVVKVSEARREVEEVAPVEAKVEGEAEEVEGEAEAETTKKEEPARGSKV